MVKTVQRSVCWWGKLPARGDFVGRGLPPRWRSDWDDWLQRGIALATTALDGAGVRDRLGSFAPWRYQALPASGETWAGILVASHDRVGRAFPLTLAERVAATVSPGESAARLASLLDAAADGPEALDAAIAALPPHGEHHFKTTASWPGRPASLWWPLAAPDEAVPHTASWPPEPALLLDLLGIQSAVHQIPSAE